MGVEAPWIRLWVEDTSFDAKAKDSKKICDQG